MQAHLRAWVPAYAGTTMFARVFTAHGPYGQVVKDHDSLARLAKGETLFFKPKVWQAHKQV